MEYSTESFERFYADAGTLLEAHYREISRYLDIPLNPDVARYLSLDAAGALRVYTVRESGLLIGYALFIVNSNAHYCDSLQAVQDVIYLDPARRRGRLGLRLIEYADTQLKKDGVQLVYHHVKTKHPALSRILEFKGYEHVEQVYAKRLDTWEP